MEKRLFSLVISKKDLGKLWKKTGVVLILPHFTSYVKMKKSTTKIISRSGGFFPALRQENRWTKCDIFVPSRRFQNVFPHFPHSVERIMWTAKEGKNLGLVHQSIFLPK